MLKGSQGLPDKGHLSYKMRILLQEILSEGRQTDSIRTGIVDDPNERCSLFRQDVRISDGPNTLFRADVRESNGPHALSEANVRESNGTNVLSEADVRQRTTRTS